VYSVAMELRSGRQQALPYSFSRWTDVPIAKWDWFMEQVAMGHFWGFDPRLAVPDRWSLAPEETLGLIFWSKDPSNLLDSPLLDMGYNIRLHHTITGWGKRMEPNAPTVGQALRTLGRACRALGPENVRWRFSPIPVDPDCLIWFDRLVHGAAAAGLREVYCSFLQENAKVPETRSLRDRSDLLDQMGSLAERVGVKVLLCREDKIPMVPGSNVQPGVCAPAEDFELPGDPSPREGCGCGLAIDPFTRNEACPVGCRYCYTVDPQAGVVRDTTRRVLPVIR
jgi:hypothetical protein